jgi:hypothetical protein
MKLRASAALLLLPLAFAASARASDADATPAPGIVDRTLSFLHLKHEAKPKGPPLIDHQMELDMEVSPLPIALDEDREVQVTIDLYNRSKKYVNLNFPTSQRIEIVVMDPTGKVTNRWSDDQSFTNDPASVTVNPGERLEYTASVPTREMSAGVSAIIQASFPSYPELTVEQRVVPAK